MENSVSSQTWERRWILEIRRVVFSVYISKVSKWLLQNVLSSRNFFYAYLLNQAPVFVGNFSCCRVIAQLLTSPARTALA